MRALQVFGTASIVDARGRRVVVERKLSAPAPADDSVVYDATTPLWRQLAAIAGEVRRLDPADRRDPERFHVDRNEVCGKLMALSRAQRPQRSAQGSPR